MLTRLNVDRLERGKIYKIQYNNIRYIVALAFSFCFAPSATLLAYCYRSYFTDHTVTVPPSQ